MGSICSKPGTHSGGHTVLGGASNGERPQTSRPDPRAAASEAAERRRQAVRRHLPLPLPRSNPHR